VTTDEHACAMAHRSSRSVNLRHIEELYTLDADSEKSKRELPNSGLLSGLGSFASAQRSVGIDDFEEWPGVEADVELSALQHLIERIAAAIVAHGLRAKLQRLKIRAEAAESATPCSLQEFG